MKLYGAPGCGSAVVEVVLQLAGQPYDYVQTSFWDQNEHFEALQKANPQAKVPTLLTLTEQHPVVAKVWEKNFGK